MCKSRAARRILLEPVVALENLHVKVAIPQQCPRLLAQIHQHIDGQAHVRSHEQGGMVRRRFDLALLRRRMARRRHDERDAAVDANRQNRHRPLGHREVDDRIQMMLNRQKIADKHPHRADADDLADVPALLGMARHVQGGAKLQFLVLTRQLNEPVPHACRRRR